MTNMDPITKPGGGLAMFLRRVLWNIDYKQYYFE